MRPNDFTDFYEILGLQPNASAEEVRDAWHRCARVYHPDVNPRKTSFRFQRAKEAYDVLSNPARRKQYDREYRLRMSLLNRGVGGRKRGNSFVGTPPGARTPPTPPRRGTTTGTRPGPTTTRPTTRPSSSAPSGSGAPPRTPPSSGASSSSGPTGGSTTSRVSSRPAAGAAKSPPGGRGAPNAPFTPGANDVRTRTSFRPATVVREEQGAGMIEALKDAIRQGGVSRVAIKHNGVVVWETHITSALLDDLARLLVGPLSSLLRLFGADQRFQVEITNELMEEYNRANRLFDEGKLEEAKAIYKRCIDRDRYFADAHLSLGAVYEAQREVPVAIECYRNAVKIDPTGEAGRFARENLRRLRGY